MPMDEHEDDEKPQGEDLGRARRFGDFDCPDCNANNPHDGFGDGDEIRCKYDNESGKNISKMFKKTAGC